VNQQIAELRREVPEIIGPPETGKKPGDFQRGMKNVLEVRINNIYQFVEDAPVIFYLNGQPVRKGQEIRLVLKEFKPNLHFSFHIRDKHAQYLEKAAQRALSIPTTRIGSSGRKKTSAGARCAPPGTPMKISR